MESSRSSKKQKFEAKIIFILALAWFFLALPGGILKQTAASAAISNDDGWNIRVDDINIDANYPTRSLQKKQPTGNEQNYFEDSKKPDADTPYSFLISNSLVDYGILSPTNNIYRTTNISLLNSNINLIVTGIEDKSLTIINSSTAIPDASCDNGSCTAITSSLWENILTYGFGYRCDNVKGSNCPLDFGQNNYYRRFANSSFGENPQEILISRPGVKSSEAQITYKLNISKSQTYGDYTNTITYTAMPGF